MLRGKILQAVSAVVLMCALPLPILAQVNRDSTRSEVNMRAGPDRAFPVVAWLPARTDISVVGCTQDGSWCDVVAGRRRGFINAAYLTRQFSSRPAPVVSFDVKEYWTAHYTRRSWFGSLDQWVDFGKPGFVPPAPPPSRLTGRTP